MIDASEIQGMIPRTLVKREMNARSVSKGFCLHNMLLVRTGEVRSEPRTELLPGLNRPRSEVHAPSPGWPVQGYMKVACHDGVVTTSCCDGGNVHLQEFRRVSGTVVLLRQVRAELG